MPVGLNTFKSLLDRSVPRAYLSFEHVQYTPNRRNRHEDRHPRRLRTHRHAPRPRLPPRARGGRPQPAKGPPALAHRRVGRRFPGTVGGGDRRRRRGHQPCREERQLPLRRRAPKGDPFFARGVDARRRRGDRRSAEPASPLAAGQHRHDLRTPLRRPERRGARHPRWLGGRRSERVALQHRRGQPVGARPGRSEDAAHPEGGDALGHGHEPRQRNAVRHLPPSGPLRPRREGGRWASIRLLGASRRLHPRHSLPHRSALRLRRREHRRAEPVTERRFHEGNPRRVGDLVRHRCRTPPAGSRRVFPPHRDRAAFSRAGAWSRDGCSRTASNSVTRAGRMPHARCARSGARSVDAQRRPRTRSPPGDVFSRRGDGKGGRDSRADPRRGPATLSRARLRRDDDA